MADQQGGLGWVQGIMDRLRAMGIRLPRSLEGIDCKEISILYKDKVILQAMSPQTDD